MIALVVGGSRVWTAGVPVDHVLARYDIVEDYAPVLIHGDQFGLDKLAGRLARRRGWNVIAVPPVAKQFRERNQRMVDILKLLKASGYDCHAACFPLPEAKGTWHLFNLVKSQMRITPEVIRG